MRQLSLFGASFISFVVREAAVWKTTTFFCMSWTSRESMNDCSKAENGPLGLQNEGVEE